MPYDQPITMRTEELIKKIIAISLPHVSEILIEGASQVEPPHPSYISVMAKGVESPAPNVPIYNVEIDIIRMSYWNEESHEDRKQATGELISLFKCHPEPWMKDSIAGSLYLEGWSIESMEYSDLDDYVGDGIRVNCAIRES